MLDARVTLVVRVGERAHESPLYAALDRQRPLFQRCLLVADSPRAQIYARMLAQRDAEFYTVRHSWLGDTGVHSAIASLERGLCAFFDDRIGYIAADAFEQLFDATHRWRDAAFVAPAVFGEPVPLYLYQAMGLVPILMMLSWESDMVSADAFERLSHDQQHALHDVHIRSLEVNGQKPWLFSRIALLPAMPHPRFCFAWQAEIVHPSWDASLQGDLAHKLSTCCARLQKSAVLCGKSHMALVPRDIALAQRYRSLSEVNDAVC